MDTLLHLELLSLQHVIDGGSSVVIIDSGKWVQVQVSYLHGLFISMLFPMPELNDQQMACFETVADDTH